MKLVTELRLKTGRTICFRSEVQMERILSIWEKADVKNRKWDRLCKSVKDPRLKDTEESKVFD